MNIDGMGSGRPNDSRGFVHKKILGLAGGVLRTVGNLPGVGLLPGGGFIRTAGDIFGSFGRSRTQPAPPQFAPSQPVILPTLPESDPMAKNRRFGIAPQDSARAFLQQGGNGACPTTCKPITGNRRVNAAGECAPPGYHWNVSGYFRKGGPCSKFEPGFVEMGTVLVKNRRMNNANGGAQDKALKRIERGQDHAKRILRATGWRTISKQSSREMRLRGRTRHR